MTMATSALDAEAMALAFGAAVRLLRQQAGLSLNELARRAGVDPALGSNARQTEQLLALAGHAPGALLELGGWDQTLAAVAELLVDTELSAGAKADFREAVRLLARRWARPEPKLE